MDFRLTVFIAVATHLNFTKAARELHISQPAVSKHIQELESSYSVQLFERVGSHIILTTSGEIFLKHAKVIIESYHMLKLQMNVLTGTYRGTLRIGASTTIAQYILPELIAKFILRFPDVRFTMLTGNSEQIELALTEHNIDMGLVEGSSRHQGLKYTHFAKDELVMVTSTQNKTDDEVTVGQIPNLPFVMREDGSGTLEVIENKIAEHGIKLSQLNVLLQLGTTEGIKSFLLNCPSTYAIISIAAITGELISNKLKVVDIAGITLEREFAFVTAIGQQNELVDIFMRTLSDNYRL